MRVLKSTSCFFKGFYYFFATILGYFVIRDLDCLPKMMGGSGDLSLLFSNYPSFEKPPYFDFYYIFITGYHIESLFTHLISEKNADYIEMIFHHVLTLNLIFFSYLTCFTKVGILILWLHLWTDVFASIARAFGNIRDLYAFISYLGLMSTWAYSRLYIFGYIIKEIYITDVQIYGVQPFERELLHYLFTALVFGLYILHLFWFYLLFRLGFDLVYLKRYEDPVTIPLNSQKGAKN